ncbi:MULTISPECIES: transcriptional regulator [unclassified Thermosipho (in: thermotogales)]|uniref:transcriptional regulator n=1 Tax=unclassified Thermosipho (in: thermotogales) TaxID=2676525 RepID=UPI000984A9EF|nr:MULTISPECIES: transcriptional regulator [unclassified Thermosipho (in: thermotogales)]MBT1247722.1 transcriptional regulator [Thermosipho sp. 1244]OOC46799.1 transcriptional regulator [Thermosipho sp. 1223]
MNELLKILSSPQLFEVLNFLKDNSNKNPSSIAKELGFHTFTVQKYLEILERFGIVSSKVERKIGRPSKKYRYCGGKITIDFDEVLKVFELKSKKIRERESKARYNYDLKKETINGVVKNGEIIKLSEVEGRVLFLVPPIDSAGILISEIVEKLNFPEFDVLFAVNNLVLMDIVEVVK